MKEDIIIGKLEEILTNFQNVPKEDIIDIRQSYRVCVFTLNTIANEYNRISKAVNIMQDVLMNPKNVRKYWADARPSMTHERISRVNLDETQLHKLIEILAGRKDIFEQLADLITANIIETQKKVLTSAGTQKEVLTSEEAAKYLGVSMSCLYKWTMSRQIPHYKSPSGKLCFFNRKEIEAWMQSFKVATNDELEQQSLKRNKKK